MYCNFCEVELNDNCYGVFCSIECMKNFYSRQKLLTSLSKSFNSNSSYKIVEQVDNKLTEISNKIFKRSRP